MRGLLVQRRERRASTGVCGGVVVPMRMSGLCRWKGKMVFGRAFAKRKSFRSTTQSLEIVSLPTLFIWLVSSRPGAGVLK